MRARAFIICTRIISFSLENPSRGLSVPLAADSVEPVFATCKSGAAKNKISSFSVFLSPLLFPSLFCSSFLSPFFRLSPPLRSLILSVRVPLGTLRLGRSEESSGVLDRSLVDPDNHRPIINGRFYCQVATMESRSLPSIASSRRAFFLLSLSPFLSSFLLRCLFSDAQKNARRLSLYIVAVIGRIGIGGEPVYLFAAPLLEVTRRPLGWIGW